MKPLSFFSVVDVTEAAAGRRGRGILMAELRQAALHGKKISLE